MRSPSEVPLATYKNNARKVTFIRSLRIYRTVISPPLLLRDCHFKDCSLVKYSPRAWHRLHALPPLAPVACFRALGIGCMFSRAWHRLHVFPRLASVACFPGETLDNKDLNQISEPRGFRENIGLVGVPILAGPQTWSQSLLFKNFRFPALGSGYMFSHPWHRLHVFSRLAPVTCFTATCYQLHFPALSRLDYLLIIINMFARA